MAPMIPIAALTDIAPGRFRLEGNIDLAAVAALVRETSRLLPMRPNGRRPWTAPVANHQVATVELDLGGIGQGSSAAVALLLEWTDQVQRNGGRLVFRNWPAPLVRIADFSNVDGLLGIHAEPPPPSSS